MKKIFVYIQPGKISTKRISGILFTSDGPLYDINRHFLSSEESDVTIEISIENINIKHDFIIYNDDMSLEVSLTENQISYKFADSSFKSFELPEIIYQENLVLHLIHYIAAHESLHVFVLENLIIAILKAAFGTEATITVNHDINYIAQKTETVSSNVIQEIPTAYTNAELSLHRAEQYKTICTILALPPKTSNIYGEIPYWVYPGRLFNSIKIELHKKGYITELKEYKAGIETYIRP